MFEKILENVEMKKPLVHCITNYVTVNDCANILLAAGASPIMADDEGEVEEIISICNALDINMGTLNQRTIVSMLKAGKKANELGLPVIFDPVGAGASTLRSDTARNLLEDVRFAVIKGNISEIKTLANGNGTTKGVDADVADVVNNDNLSETIAFAKGLSASTGAVIAITGAIDVVAGRERAYVIRNGNPFMSRITGTGCMLAAVTAAYCGANPGELLDATAAAVCVMGICGEIAYDRMKNMDGGTSTYRMQLIDAMSRINSEILKGSMMLEIK